MPAAVAVPLILGAASAGTTIATAKMASNTAKNAANTQAQYANRALDIAQQQYQDAQQRFAPYAQLGQSMMPGLQQFLSSTVPRGISSPFPAPSAGPGGYALPPLPRTLAGYAGPPAMTNGPAPSGPAPLPLSSYAGRGI